MPHLVSELKMPRALRTFVIGYLLLHLLAAVVFVWALTVSVRSLMNEAAREKMQAMAIMLSEHVEELELKMNDPGLPEHLRQLGQKTQFRFSLIDGDGHVIADSQTGTWTLVFTVTVPKSWQPQPGNPVSPSVTAQLFRSP